MTNTRFGSNPKQQTVLITGASSGIGLALARLFADRECHLILVARDQQRLNRLAAELNAQKDCQVTVIAQDLAQSGGAQAVFTAVAGSNWVVDILVNNAGAGRSGRVIDADPGDNAAMVELNITALTELSRLFATAMVQRGSGQILNVASTGAYQPGPYTAVYYAAKAYIRSFSLALANELQGTGVSVSILCPGATATEFSRRAGKTPIRSRA
jgi:short-subunit dehydrogenase